MYVTRGDALRACPWLLYSAPSALCDAESVAPSVLRFLHLLTITKKRESQCRILDRPNISSVEERWMKVTLVVLVLSLAGFSVKANTTPQVQLTITAVNKLKLARPSETIELTAQALAPLGEKDLTKLHVRDASRKEVLCQAVDTDYDDYHKPDLLIFQADFAPNETKTFTITAGKKREYTKEDFRAYGRFVRERFDDFAWENDRIAHRTYGKAMITWKGEPLTSSAIDIWSKRTAKLVITDWYMVDNYHTDQGEGV